MMVAIADRLGRTGQQPTPAASPPRPVGQDLADHERTRVRGRVRGCETANAAQVLDHLRLLQLEVEQDGDFDPEMKLFELAATLLPRPDAVSRAEGAHEGDRPRRSIGLCGTLATLSIHRPAERRVCIVGRFSRRMFAQVRRIGPGCVHPSAPPDEERAVRLVRRSDRLLDLLGRVGHAAALCPQDEPRQPIPECVGASPVRALVSIRGTPGWTASRWCSNSIGPDERHQLPRVGDVHRVDAEELAGGGDRRVDRNVGHSGTTYGRAGVKPSSLFCQILCDNAANVFVPGEVALEKDPGLVVCRTLTAGRCCTSKRALPLHWRTHYGRYAYRHRWAAGNTARKGETDRPAGVSVPTRAPAGTALAPRSQGRRGTQIMHSRRRAPLIVAALIAAGVIVAASGVGPAAAATAQLTRYPYLTDVVAAGGTDNATVNFATDQTVTAAYVTLGPAGGTCAGTTRTGSKTAISVTAVPENQWRVKLPGLTAGTSYCYRLHSGSPTAPGADLLASDASPVFATPPAPGSTSSFEFAVWGDWGFTNTSGTNPDQAALDARIAASGALFALGTGDTAYPGGSQTNYGDLN
jgi:hypothetical protein